MGGHKNRHIKCDPKDGLLKSQDSEPNATWPIHKEAAEVIVKTCVIDVKFLDLQFVLLWNYQSNVETTSREWKIIIYSKMSTRLWMALILE